MSTSEEVRYEVNFAGTQTFAVTLRSRLKEIFIPDDPFRHLQDLPPRTKAHRILKYFVPILEWGPRYTFNEFRYDLLAGITVASLAIPQGISYARLAEIPPIIGLYSSFVPPLVYAIFGSSKNLAVGTVAASSLLLNSIIRQVILPEKDMKLYIGIVMTAAFFTGIIQMTLGVFRLGFVVDFLSRSTITGFMGGTAILIIMQQLKGMLGMTRFTTKTDVISVLHAVFEYRDDWQWQSFVMGICFLAFLLGTRYLKFKVPRLFWVSAISPLVVVIVGGLVAFFLHGATHGIPIVGPLKKGLNPISIGNLVFTPPYLQYAVKAGSVTGFIALAEGIAVGRSLALMKNHHVDGNKEMIAFGLMNIAGSFTSCYLTTAPFSKSAVNSHAGSKTAMSNIVQAICMMLVLLFLAPLFKYTPLVALATIIIVAMIGLLEFKEMVHLFKVDKFDFCVCMAAFLGVAFLSMLQGLMISVGLSIIRALLCVARPITCKLGRLQGTNMYRDIEHYPDASTIPGILILNVGSPVYFASANYLRERITRWVQNEERSFSETQGDIHYVILDMGGATAIDKSGIGMLEEVHKYLKKRGTKMVLCNPRLEIIKKLITGNIIDLIGADWIFLTIKDAVKACEFALQEHRRQQQDAV
ncbi:probable sulfate transporter 3.5 [Dioscorea cayenensis subsp. rotundata]|uniref:Probable sulfate transporter 3.5 n=1 Tax=Dioscorea cayennensis subsp. rotundata TaxID=55577 RepID=A0AB40AQZ4_DIOCR|nr:probable sulfate transporter 3.5 [Dioscorea cayenensis subsp. rotundata]